ncbi:efflux RND transporter periplasmic adaptor subunit [bacterium]|nr:MAG: efflux RND transporter periplasmic adaptor subunit [bacterium]
MPLVTWLRKLVWIVPILAIGGLTFKRIAEERTKTGDQAKQSQARRNQKPSVETAVAGPRDIVEVVRTIGTVESLETVQVSPRTSGRLLSVLVREGDSVTKGQLIATLDPADLQGAITEAQAGVAQAQATLSSSLATQGSNNANLTGQIQTQQAAVQGAQAELVQAQRTAEATVAAQKAAVAETESRLEAARTGVKSAQAGVTSAQANEKNAQGRADRSATLFEKGYISAQANEDAQAQLSVRKAETGVAVQNEESARSNVNAVQAQVKAAQAQVGVARRQTEAAIATAKSRLAQAQAALRVARANTAQTPAYQRTLEAQQAAVNAAQSRLTQAQARAADTNLYSPIDGTVTDRAADPGTIASPGTAILTLRSVSNLEIAADLPEDQAQVIVPGSKGKVTIDDRPYDVTVARVNRSVDTQSRRFTVQLRFVSPPGEVRPGNFARVELTARSRSVLVAVPIAALDDGNVDVIDSENKAQRREVVEGARDADFVEIKSGIQPGDKVVVQSYTQPKEGQEVRTGEKKGETPAGGSARPKR